MEKQEEEEGDNGGVAVPGGHPQHLPHPPAARRHQVDEQHIQRGAEVEDDIGDLPEGRLKVVEEEEEERGG